MPLDMENIRQDFFDLIEEFGYLAILRMPGGVDRFVIAIDAGFFPEERLGRVSNPADRHHCISSISPITGEKIDIDEKEMLITLQLDDDGMPILDGNGKPLENEKLRQVAPPHAVGSHNIKHLYWNLTVRQ